MICPKCGQSCLDDATFCYNCGSKLESLPAVQPAPQAAPNDESTQYTTIPTPEDRQQANPQCSQPVNPQYGQQYTPQVQPQFNPQYAYQYNPNYAHTYSQQPATNWSTPSSETAAKVLETVKTVGTSPLFLIAVILFSVSVLLSFINSLIPSVQAPEYISELADLFEMFDMGDILDELYESAGSVSIVSAVTGIIPGALLVTGMWMTYTFLMRGRMQTSGLTMIKVIVIIDLVALSVVLGLVELILVFALTVASGLGNADEAAIVIGVLIIVLAAAMALLIVYYAKLNKTINVVKSTVVTGIPSDRVSPYVAIFNFVSGGISALASLTSFNSGVLDAISSFCSSVAIILFGAVILVYRGRMRGFMNPWAWQSNYTYGQPTQNYTQQYNYGASSPYLQNGGGAPGTYSHNAASSTAAASAVCPRCGGQCGAQEAFCPHCGTTLKNP